MSLRTINNPPQIMASGSASQEIAGMEFFLSRPLREQQEKAMQNLAKVVAQMAQRGVEG